MPEAIPPEATQARQRPCPLGACLWSRQVHLWGQEGASWNQEGAFYVQEKVAAKRPCPQAFPPVGASWEQEGAFYGQEANG